MVLGEIIKKESETSLEKSIVWKTSFGIILFWIVTSPFWKWFISGPMASDSEIITKIVVPVMPFYIFYLLSTLFSSWFISTGKLWCNTVVSIGVNIVYYGVVYLLFKQGTFEANMNFIIMMFGLGMVFNCLISAALYLWQRKRKSS